MNITVIAPGRDVREKLTSCFAGQDAYKLFCCSSPDAGLIHVINERPDIVFLDVDSLESAGWDVLSGLTHYNSVKLVVVTESEAYAPRAMSLGAEGYLLKPLSEKAVRTLLARILPPTPRHVEVRTFGRFDVFAGGMPVYFQNAKAKELLALLVDKRGTVTMELAVNVLWDDRHYDERVKQLYRKAVSYLHRLFQEVEPELFVSNRGSCYVNCERFACDYYDLLKGRPEALAAFNGEYMFEYPWAEATLAQIENIALANGGNRRPEE